MSGSWPGLNVNATNAQEIFRNLYSGPLRRGGEVWSALSGLGPRMIEGRPEYSTLVYGVIGGVVSLGSVTPSDDMELKTAAENIVTILQSAKDKPGP